MTQLPLFDKFYIDRTRALDWWLSHHDQNIPIASHFSGIGLSTMYRWHASGSCSRTFAILVNQIANGLMYQPGAQKAERKTPTFPEPQIIPAPKLNEYQLQKMRRARKKLADEERKRRESEQRRLFDDHA